MNSFKLSIFFYFTVISSEKDILIEKIQIMKSEITDHIILLDHYLDDLVVGKSESENLEKLKQIATCLKKNVQSLRDLHEIIVSDCTETENA